MKKISSLLFWSLCLILWSGCGQEKYPAGNELEVSWKVISNEYADQPGVKAQFTLENKSNFTLTDTNWALFFNQTPREIVKTEGDVQIARISGDWFKMVPEEGFILKPGQKVEIVYEASHWLIKESDAPMGPYFVFYGEDGAEKSVVEVTSLVIEPFTEPQQINRYRNDGDPICTKKGWNRKQVTWLPSQERLQERRLHPGKQPNLQGTVSTSGFVP